jgi:hypothetical protein
LVFVFRLLDLVAGGIVKNAVTVDIQDAVTEVLGGTGSGVLLVCIVKGGRFFLFVLGLDVEVGGDVGKGTAPTGKGVTFALGVGLKTFGILVLPPPSPYRG